MTYGLEIYAEAFQLAIGGDARWLLWAKEGKEKQKSVKLKL